MKYLLYIPLLLLSFWVNAQTALFNNGNLRIHEEGAIGFHTNLINEAPFDNNLGLVGFYSPSNLAVQGDVVPQFYDIEIATELGLFLELGIDNSNNTNFILGDIQTPRNEANSNFNFLQNGFYNGEGNSSKIDGYAAITNQQNFTFPVGDAEFLRPLIVSSESENPFSRCAYFFENPSTPSTLSGSFDTAELALDLAFVSPLEFWRLEGSAPSTISLSWNVRSGIGNLTEEATKVVVAGWSKAGSRWENLGANPVAGTLEEGFVTSDSFVPDDYEIITLGISKEPFEPLSMEVLSLDNYFVSVNGDGINDSFFIPELEDSPNNLVQIYDRYGLKVFEKANYRDEFVGVANVGDFIFNKEDGLPVGVYFYTVYMADLDLNYQGFLYLAR
jgi:gliding motility-associated-like protein